MMKNFICSTMTYQVNFLIKATLCLMFALFLMIGSRLHAQTVRWNGNINTDWGEPNNWNTNTIPTIHDDVDIPNTANDPVIMTGTVAFAKSVFNRNGAIWTIQHGAEIQIENSTADGIENNGEIINDGTIELNGSTEAGIKNNDTFTNTGFINIGESTTSGGAGLINSNGSVSFTNEGGSIYIHQTTASAIVNGTNIIFENINNGQIYIGQNGGSIGEHGIRSSSSGAVFINNASTVLIDNTNNHGLFLNTTTFTNTNSGILSIGQNDGNIGRNGISLGDNASLINESDSEIRIDNYGKWGLNCTSDLLNEENSSIIIGEIGPTGEFSIRSGNEGNITNEYCSTIVVYQNVSAQGIFNNNGLFDNVNGLLDENVTLINNGIFSGSIGPEPDFTNNEIFVEPVTSSNCSSISPVLNFGNPVDLDVLGIFANRAATVSAGTYDSGTNTFAPDPELAEGTHTLYVKFEDTTNGCIYTSSWLLTTGNCCNDPVMCYLDADGDTYGDPNAGQLHCTSCTGDFVPDNSDCDDADSDEFPNQMWYIDADGDSYGASSTVTCERPANGFLLNELMGTGTDDCDDNDANKFPNQMWYIDADNDDYGASSTTACERPTDGFLLSELMGTGTDDCDDSDANEYPNQMWYIDADGDSYGASSTTACERPANGFLLIELMGDGTDDCDDNDANEFPDQTWYIDADGDDYGASSTTACERPTDGFLLSELMGNGTDDCDDSDANEFPDQTWYIDADGDSYSASSTTSCERPNDGFLLSELMGTGTDDCDDSDANEFPNQTWYIDADGDNYTPGTTQSACQRPDGYKLATELVSTSNLDCNDEDSNVNPNPDCTSTTRIWTGAIDTDWNTPCNWTPNCVPTSVEDVIIPVVSNNPVILDGIKATAKSITMNEHSELTVDEGGDLTIEDPSGNSLSIYENASFNINSCGTVSFAGALNNLGSLTNEGLLIIDSDLSHVSTGTFTNLGVLSFPKGNLIPNVANNEIIIAPVVTECGEVSPAFDFENPINFNILGVYTDVSTTISAGSYDESTNTFSSSLGAGSHILFVKIEDPSNACTFITNWSVEFTNSDSPIKNKTFLPDLRDDCAIYESEISVPTATDDCDGIIYGVPDGPLNFTNQGIYGIKWTYEDSDGNKTFQFQIVIILDNDEPVPVCKSNSPVELDVNGTYSIQESDVLVSATDNCGTVNFIKATPEIVSCEEVGNIVNVTVEVEDGFGNSAECTATIVVGDTNNPCCEAPVANCQNHEAILDAEGEVTITVSDINNGSFADCGQQSLELDIAVFDCADVSNNPQMVNLILTDINGDSDQCTAEVTVKDETDPELSCPPVIQSQNNDAAICTYTVQGSEFDPTNVNDNCGVQSLVNDFNNSNTLAGEILDLGPTLITWTVTDVNGRITNCSFTVVVEDNDIPVFLTCPENITKSMDAGQCGAVVNWTEPTASDNCDANPHIELFGGEPSGSFFLEGTTTIEYIAQDDASNPSFDCTFTITILPDAEKPSLACPGNIDVAMDTGLCGAVVNWTAPTAMDNCDGSFIAAQTTGAPSGTLFSVGIYDIGYTATDSEGNYESCSFTLTVQPDSELPVPDCKLNTPVSLDANGTYYLQDADVYNGGTDNCGTINFVSADPVMVDCSDAGNNVLVTVTVNDGNGNVNTCIATVDVQDNSLPLPDCLHPTVVLDENGNYTFHENDVFSGGTDNCSSISFLNVTPATVDCSHVGSTVSATVTAVDASGNQATCTALVTVEDNELPEPNCVHPTVSLNALGIHNLSVSEVFGGGTDNCGTVSFVSMSLSSVDCNDVGTSVSVIVTGEDLSGNQQTCISNVTVVDDTEPTALCQNLTVQLDSDGQASIAAIQIDGGSTDNCGDVYTSINISSFTCSDVGTNSVTMTVSDMTGNHEQCNATVSVEDNIAPTARCVTTPINVTLDTNGEYTVDPNDLDNGSSDACGIQTLSANPSLLDCSDEGVNTITLTITDVNGNSSSCEVSIDVATFFSIDEVIETDETCDGAGDGSIQIEASSAGGQVGYSVDGGTNFQFGNTFNSLTPGNYDVVVKIFGINGLCEKTATATIGSGSPSETWYKDLDGDGHSDGLTINACVQPSDYYSPSDLESIDGDCNDNDPDEYPGQTWYEDFDGDGFSSGIWSNACQRPSGCFTMEELDSTEGDCDDFDAGVHPGATEICNGIDDDCDGEIDEGTTGGLTLTGNIAFYTQAQVNAFSQCYSVIDGNVTISGADITDLSNLGNLEQITENLTIQYTSISSMEGLDSLKDVGGSLTIFYNFSLTTLEGLNALDTVGTNLMIYYNFSLSDGCPIYHLVNGGVSETVNIFLNATGCNSVTEINANCGPNNLVSNPNQEQTTFKNAIAPSTRDRQHGPSFKVFPNPTTYKATVHFDQKVTNGQVVVTDVSGREVWKRGVVDNMDHLVINLSNWRAGIYFVHVKLEGRKMVTKRLIKIDNR
ncbi:MAG: HYR domain-containing protein [Bacteroidota bacterium]